MKLIKQKNQSLIFKNVTFYDYHFKNDNYSKVVCIERKRDKLGTLLILECSEGSFEMYGMQNLKNKLKELYEN